MPPQDRDHLGRDRYRAHFRDCSPLQLAHLPGLPVVRPRAAGPIVGRADTLFSADAITLIHTLRQLATEASASVTDPDTTTIKHIAHKLRYTEQEQRSLLASFIAGGDLSAGGIMHAATSLAQTLPDGDAAHEMETSATHAMRIAATH